MKFIATALMALVFSIIVLAQEHDHHDDDGKHSHSDEKESHTESEEEGGSVGPDKGILEFSQGAGFKLSPEALKNFEIKTLKLIGNGPWRIPRNAFLYSGEEINLFRMRSGFFKRIDFKTVQRTGVESTVDSDDLREGDEVVLSGLGFLRIAELAASGGVAHGHSH